MRARRYWEIPHGRWLGKDRCCAYRPFLRSYFQCEKWSVGQPVPWFAVDRADCGFGQCDVYNLDGIAYESILLHGLAILWGPDNGGEMKNNSIHIGFSRDGFHISRPPPPGPGKLRVPFIATPRPFRNPRGKHVRISNLQLAQGSPIIAGDRLFFYFGYAMKEYSAPTPILPAVHSNYVEATGLAVLRRDGFASFKPRHGTPNGRLTTRPLVFSGAHLFVNVILRENGKLRVEVLSDEAPRGRPLCGLSWPESSPLLGPLDKTSVVVPPWTSGVPLESVAGRRVRFRFNLVAGELFSFWVARDKRGSSGGFLGGGEFGKAQISDE